MPYRKLGNGVSWHWCHNCSGWPLHDFQQHEDKPPTWNRQALCEECARRDDCNGCQHSITRGAGGRSVSHRTDRALSRVPVHLTAIIKFHGRCASSALTTRFDQVSNSLEHVSVFSLPHGAVTSFCIWQWLQTAGRFPDYAGLSVARLFGPAPRGLRRLPVLGLRNSCRASTGLESRSAKSTARATGMNAPRAK
jgi:hypothetical protein